MRPIGEREQVACLEFGAGTQTLALEERMEAFKQLDNKVTRNRKWNYFKGIVRWRQGQAEGVYPKTGRKPE